MFRLLIGDANANGGQSPRLQHRQRLVDIRLGGGSENGGDAPSVAIELGNSIVVIDLLSPERRMAVHFEPQHLPEVLRRRQRQTDRAAKDAGAGQVEDDLLRSQTGSSRQADELAADCGRILSGQLYAADVPPAIAFAMPEDGAGAVDLDRQDMRLVFEDPAQGVRDQLGQLPEPPCKEPGNDVQEPRHGHRSTGPSARPPNGIAYRTGLRGRFRRKPREDDRPPANSAVNPAG